ncbi:MAG TPA: helix-turn-helix transcriptional regulator [Azospirillum sp.]|nr:helix-turn-helix transcriptional regulator [Azospirillum sp.]
MVKQKTQQPTGPKSEDDEGGPNAVDVHVGSRIRLRRTLMGMSQTALAESVGLTFQQIQKYEKGGNRVSASRLWQFGQVLDVPVSFFFDDMPQEILSDRGHPGATSTAGDSESTGVMTRRETLELVRAYYRIQNEPVRRRIYELFKAMGSAGDESSKD